MAMQGRSRVKEQLLAMGGGGMVRRVGAALYAGGELLRTEAQISITRGAVSGKGHVPSAPGEPPNNDTGVLAGDIENVQKAPLVVEVSSNAPYASDLEHGTSKIAERPYMRPARDKTKEQIRTLVAQAVDRELKGKK